MFLKSVSLDFFSFFHLLSLVHLTLNSENCFGQPAFCGVQQEKPSPKKIKNQRRHGKTASAASLSEIGLLGCGGDDGFQLFCCIPNVAKPMMRNTSNIALGWSSGRKGGTGELGIEIRPEWTLHNSNIYVIAIQNSVLRLLLSFCLIRLC